MKKGWALIALCVLILVVGGMPRASYSATVATTMVDSAVWQSEVVDSGDGIGSHLSVAVDPVRGSMYISYYDSTNGDLKAARYVGSGGNCGIQGSWQCETVDSAGNVGMYNDIAINPVNGLAGIAYYDASTQSLKVAFGCIGMASCTWITATVERGVSGVFSYGVFPSLVYTSDGTAYIAHKIRGLGGDSLQVAYYVGSHGNCGVDTIAGQWQCDTVDTGLGVGMYPSLVVDSSNVQHIAYYDSGNNALYYAKGSLGSYYIYKIVDVAGKFVSMTLDEQHNNTLHMAFYEESTNSLEYAVYVGTSGNCGFNSNSLHFEWECSVIDSMGSGQADARGIAIAVDADGNPLIAYGADYALKIAYPASMIGNCGPAPNTFYTWMCDTLIPDSIIQSGEMKYIDIGINNAGLYTIGYYGGLSTLTGKTSVQAVYQRFPVYLPLTIK
ncbi:MAG: hypothetical protein D6694_08675 [Gammaproteobacteria bacterium]|nr:MAG: hypothetical protein D6694_08675 [Gammaproteobacteria bacterium]